MMGAPPRLMVAAAAAALILAACGGAGSEGTRPSPTAGPTTAPPPAPTDLTELTRDDLTRVLSPDSIPSIDDPQFESPEEAATWLAPEEPVVVLEIEGDARAYPFGIMTWHEIVNDVVGGEPIVVTYCPLCNSALAYPRTVKGRILEFGTSGSLYNSALVMYDRQTDSWWLHFEAIAIEGPLEGTKLDLIPVQTLSLERFREEHPDGKVLSRETGVSRNYGQNPYDFYDTGERPFLFDGEIDDRREPMARVVGVEVDGEAVAYPYELLGAQGDASVVHDRVAGTDVVVFWASGVRSALDTPEIATGRDVGSFGVFLPRAGERDLVFRSEGDRIVDSQTGSEWSLAGRAVSGPLQGQELTALPHLDTFWFAWSSHNPDTEIFTR